MSRYLFRGFVERHGGRYLEPINRGVETDGPYYLLTLRMVPIFFFFVVNAVVGLTRMRTRTFWISSQLGMLPLTMVIVYTGTQITCWRSPRDLLSVQTLLALTLLGLLPLLLRRLVRYFRPVSA
jgi:uncharacterized membrane protein YdjX (TVP38/TMEM64 family)